MYTSFLINTNISLKNKSCPFLFHGDLKDIELIWILQFSIKMVLNHNIYKEIPERSIID